MAKYTVKKRRVAKKNWRQYAGKALSSFSKESVKTLKKRLGLNPEMKYYDQANTTTATTTLAPFVTPAIGLAQGGTDITRNGSGIRIDRFTLKCLISNPIAETLDHQLRFIVVWIKDIRAGGPPPVGSILQVTTAITSPYSMDGQGYTVLSDRRVRVTTVAGGNTLTEYNYRWNPTAAHVNWTSADTIGTLNNLEQGYLGCFVMMDQAAAVSAPTFQWYSRIHFVDN